MRVKEPITRPKEAYLLLDNGQRVPLIIEYAGHDDRDMDAWDMTLPDYADEDAILEHLTGIEVDVLPAHSSITVPYFGNFTEPSGPRIPTQTTGEQL